MSERRFFPPPWTIEELATFATLVMLVVIAGAVIAGSLFGGWTLDGLKAATGTLFDGWPLSDTIAAIVSLAALLQFLALLIVIAVMVRASRRQLRAYVFPRDAGLFEGMMLVPPLPAHTNEPGVVLNFYNSGQTPAYRAVVWAGLEIIDPAREDGLVVPKFQANIHTAIGSNETMPKTLWYGRALTDTEIGDINDQVQAIYLYGRLEYRDAFKKRRYCNFRLRYNGQFPPPEGVLLLHCENGNDAD
jgi:hypothetical protein